MKKKYYNAPGIMVYKVSEEAVIAVSNVEYGGSNTGDDVPKTAEGKEFYDFDIVNDNEE